MMTKPSIRAQTPQIDTRRFAPIEHNFSAHPAMAMPALHALANRLAGAGQCRGIAPGTTQGSAFKHHPIGPGSRGIDAIFDKIDEPGAWVALYNVETDPAYADFLGQVRQAFEPLVAHQQSGIYNVGGFIFISSAPSVTPFHIDRENNFWLQVRGSKTISVWPANDPAVVSQEICEKFIANRDLTGVSLRDEIRSRQRDFHVTAGQGLYFPCLTPHTTRCEPAPGSGKTLASVSIGVVFYSDQTRHQARVLAFNQLLRRAAFSPRPPHVLDVANRAPLVDRAKALGGAAFVKLNSALGRFPVPPGL